MGVYKWGVASLDALPESYFNDNKKGTYLDLEPLPVGKPHFISSNIFQQQCVCIRGIVIEGTCPYLPPSPHPQTQPEP